MNRKLLLAFAFAALWMNMALMAQAQHKRALLVAVNGYDDPQKHGKDSDKRWWKLNTIPDVEAIRDALVHHFGFNPDPKAGEILILSAPEDTTHDAILKNFREFLVKQTQPGDIVYFHYSGHGSTASDSPTASHGKPYRGNLHPGDKPNGIDQTLIPSDYAGKHDPSNDIFGDEIGQVLSELKRKQPGNVTLTFDCCFAGTNTRGGRMLVRGMTRDIPAPDSGARQTGADQPHEEIIDRDPKSLNYTVLAATRSDQVAEETDDEGKDMGLFTYALVRALNETTEQTNYHSLFTRIAALMAQRNHSQQPLIEGPQNIAILGTKPVANAQTYSTDIRSGHPVLRAGRLHGMTSGTTLKIYKANAGLSPESLLTEATVEAVDSIYSTLKLTKANVKNEDLLGAQAVIKERAYPDKPLLIDISGLEKHPRHGEILAVLQRMETENRTIRLVSGKSTAWNVRLSMPGQEKSATAAAKGRGEATAENALRVENDEGSPLWYNLGTDEDPRYVNVLPDSDKLPQQIQDMIERESRWRLVTGLKNDDPGKPMHVEVRLIPIEVKRDAAGKVVRDSHGSPIFVRENPTPEQTGPTNLAIGEYFEVEVKNTGDRTVYVTLIDLSSDGSISAVWPKQDLDPQNRLEPGQAKRVRWSDNEPVYYLVTAPAGKELFKAIVTEEPSDFSMLVDDNAGTRARGGEKPEGQSPLGKWLLNAKERNRTRGPKADRGVLPANWATADQVLLVVEPTGARGK